MPYANINGVKTYYETHGWGKEWLVLVHAMSMSSRMWSLQLKEFGKKFKLLIYDIRGQGKSDSCKEDFSIELFAADLKELCDFLKIEKANFLGLSMGGMVCQQFAINYPEKVKKLVLCDTYHHVSNTGDRFLLSWVEEVTKLSKRFATFLTNETQFPRESEELFYDFFKKESGKVSKEDQLKLLSAVRNFDVSGSIKKIKAKTLILTGEDEVNFHKYEEEMHKQIKNSELRVILGALHLTNMEKPEEFNKAVMAFLTK